MSDELIAFIVAEVNKRINIPFLNEEQEAELYRIVLEVIFLKLFNVFKLDKDSG